MTSSTMLSLSFYFPFVSIIVITLLIIIMLYCIRLNHVHCQVLPYSMQVFIIAGTDQHQTLYSQMLWTSSFEAPPPSYNTVVQLMNTSPTTTD